MTSTLAACDRVTYRYPVAARYSGLTKAVLAALGAWPLSDRELARRARIPAPTLVKIRKSEGFGASDKVAGRILAALAQWRGEMRDAVREVRKAERRIARELARPSENTSNGTEG